jgi:hypothetical protein
MPYTTGYTVGSSTASGTIDPVWQGWNTASSTTTTSFSVQRGCLALLEATSDCTTALTAAQQFAAEHAVTQRRVGTICRGAPGSSGAYASSRNARCEPVVERQREMELMLCDVKREEAEASWLGSAARGGTGRGHHRWRVAYLKVRGGVSGRRLPDLHQRWDPRERLFLLDEHGCQPGVVLRCASVSTSGPQQRGVRRGGRGELTTIPNSDAWLGQYLALKYNETGYLAQVQPVGRWPGVARQRSLPDQGGAE